MSILSFMCCVCTGVRLSQMVVDAPCSEMNTTRFVKVSNLVVADENSHTLPFVCKMYAVQYVQMYSTACPNVQSACPNVQSACLNVQSACPNVQSACPNVQSACPNVQSACPNVQSACPNVQSACPNVQSADPYIQSACLHVQVFLDC